MKTLLLLRHAKTQPDAPNGDKERALTRHGERDATAIGKVIQNVVGRPDVIVASDARRAQQTAALVAQALEFTAPVTTEPAIYDAESETLLEVVQGLPDDAGIALLIGHNPGFQELGAELVRERGAISHLPTAGLLHLTFDAAHWADVRPRTGMLNGTHVPD